MKRYVIIGAVVLVAVAALFFALRPRPVEVQFATVERRDVEEYVSEDAETRLAHTWVIDMPVSGTLKRIELLEGDAVSTGQVVAHVDPFDLERALAQAEAQIARARARIIGVDTAKPKPEDIELHRVRVQEMRDAEAMGRRERNIAEAAFREVERNYERARNLREDNAVSQAYYDSVERAWNEARETVERVALAHAAARKAREQAELALASLRESVDDNEYLRDVYLAEIEALEARADVVRSDLAKTGIRSPIDGVVLTKYVEDSRTLQVGTPLLELGNLDDIEIESDILSEEVVRVAVGNRVEVSGAALKGREVQGSVKRIYPAGFEKVSALGIRQQRVKIRVDFDNRELGLRPGTSVDIRVITDESPNTLAVPERATFRHEDDWAVFVVRDGRARLTRMTLGIMSDDWAEVLEGLEEGGVVVAELKNEVDDGVAVASSD